MTEPLWCGTSSESVNSTQNESDRSDGDDDTGEEESRNRNSWNRNRNLGISTSIQSATESKKISRKRNFSEQSPVPNVIDNKWRHLERQLRAVQKEA